MPSYVAFRDMSSVFTAGHGFAQAGMTLGAAAKGGREWLESRKKEVIKGTDGYSEGFLTGVYEKDDRVGKLFAQGDELLEHTSKLGPDVILAAKRLLWTDAVHGANMYPSSA
jgi:hypothetical protein